MDKIQRPTVLIIEDSFPQQQFYRKRIDRCCILRFMDAKAAMESHVPKHVSVVVIGACLTDAIPTARPIVERIRRLFKGTIIAGEDRSEYSQELLKAGCDYSITKRAIPEAINGLIKSHYKVQH